MVILVVAAVVVAGLVAFDIITSGPHVPTSTFMTDESAVAVSVLPGKSGLSSMVSDALGQDGRSVDFIMPWELGMVLDLDASGTRRTLTFAASPRHLGPLAMLLLGNPDVYRASHEMNVEGIDTWTPENWTREKGAMVLRGAGDVSPGTLQRAAGIWPQRASPLPPALEGGHFIEIAVDNHGGRAFLALEDILEPELAEQTAPAAEAEASAQDMPSAGPSAGESRPAILTTVLRYVVSARITGDMEGRDLLTVRADIACPDEASALQMVSLLKGFEAMLNHQLRDRHVTTEATVTPQGNQVRGTFHVSGLRPLIVETIRTHAR